MPLPSRTDSGSTSTPGLTARAFLVDHVEVAVDVRQQVGLVHHHQVGGREHLRVLQRLVVALGHGDHDHAAVLAHVEQRRADQVADVLDEQQRPLARVQRAERPLDHRGVEVAAGTGVDLDGVGAGAGDALGIGRGLLVALDHADLAAARGLGDGALQQRGLARSRRAHQVDCPDPAPLQPGPVVRREVVVVREHALLDREQVGAGLDGVGVRVRVRLPRLATAAGHAHAGSLRTATDVTTRSSPATTLTSALPHPQSRTWSSQGDSAPQVRQAIRPGTVSSSRVAPSSRVPAVAISKQNRIASGSTPVSAPTRSRTSVT